MDAQGSAQGQGANAAFRRFGQSEVSPFTHAAPYWGLIDSAARGCAACTHRAPLAKPRAMNDASSPTLDKTFDPAAIEAKWYAHWESTGLFRPERPHATPFTIVNPPPNVTGSLHIGHALDNTLQTSSSATSGFAARTRCGWSAPITPASATQMVVERQMEAKQDKRTNYTREQFIEKVWEWKAESGGTITGQLRRLGCSMDWSRSSSPWTRTSPRPW